MAVPNGLAIWPHTSLARRITHTLAHSKLRSGAVFRRGRVISCITPLQAWDGAWDTKLLWSGICCEIDDSGGCGKTSSNIARMQEPEEQGS